MNVDGFVFKSLYRLAEYFSFASLEARFSNVYSNGGCNLNLQTARCSALVWDSGYIWV